MALLPEPILGQTKPSEPYLEVVSIVSSVSVKQIYYSKFDKDQTFIFVCRRSCLSDTFYDKYVEQLSLYKHDNFY